MKIVSLEGIGGSGKSALASVVQRELLGKGVRVLLYKPVTRERLERALSVFPGSREDVWVCRLPVLPPRVEMLCYLALLVADSTQFVESEYDLVLLDRYIDTMSTIVAARNNVFHRKLDFAEFYGWVKDTCYKEIRMPDRTIVLDVEIATAEQRTLQREGKSYSDADRALFSKIAEFYRLISNQEPSRMCFLHSSAEVEVVLGETLQIVTPLLDVAYI